MCRSAGTNRGGKSKSAIMCLRTKLGDDTTSIRLTDYQGGDQTIHCPLHGPSQRSLVALHHASPSHVGGFHEQQPEGGGS